MRVACGLKEDEEMKAVVLTAYGALDKLELRDVPDEFDRARVERSSLAMGSHGDGDGASVVAAARAR